MMIEEVRSSTLVLYGEALPEEKEKLNNWFVLFVQTGREQIACDMLNLSTSITEFSAFFPKIEYIKKNNGTIDKIRKALFPGYIFIKTNLDPRYFIIHIMPTIRFSKYTIKLLGKHTPDTMALPKKEKQEIMQFCDDKYIIKESFGFIKGDKIIITSGPLQGCDSIIKKIDRHKRRADIELQFMGDTRQISLPLEIISKI